MTGLPGGGEKARLVVTPALAAADLSDIASPRPSSIVPRVERSVGETVPTKRLTTYDADDQEIPSFLRRK